MCVHMYVNFCSCAVMLFSTNRFVSSTSRSRTLSSKKREKKSIGEASASRVVCGPCVLVNGGSVGGTSVAESATSHCKLLVWPEER